VLGIFNLLPAFPLDGGRTLRAIIWSATGSLSLATKVAAGSGQAMGILLFLLGVWQVLQGNLWGGLWFAFIGVFLNRSANTARREMKVQTSLSGFGVKDAMRLDPPTIDPDASVSSVVYGPLVQQSTRAVPVCEGGVLVGIISLSDIKGVPQHRWALATVRERMTHAPLWTLKPEDGLVHGLEMLGEHSINQAPVLEEGRLVGLLSRADIIQFMHLNSKLDFRRGRFGQG
jgi:CBS domain-containing protein